MKRLILFIFSGFDYDHYYKHKYFAHKGSGEIHRLDNLQRTCSKTLESNRVYLSEYGLRRYLKRHPGSNGCFLCNPEYDTDVYDYQASEDLPINKIVDEYFSDKNKT